MKKMREFFAQNILWKILSFVLAVALWFIAVNIQNPINTRDYSTNIQIRNLEALSSNNLVMLNEEHIRSVVAQVRVTARWSELNTISPSNITAYIDMESINLTDENITNSHMQTMVNVHVDTNHDHQVTVVRPVNVFLALDRVVTEEIPVVVEKASDVEGDFVSLSPTVEPATIWVTGAQSHVESIRAVVAEIEVESDSNVFTTSATPIIYDHEGENITHNFQTNVSEVQINVPINRNSSIPVVRPSIIGQVAAGHSITGISFEPQRIEVTGSISDVEALQNIALAGINVSGATTTQRATLDVRDALVDANVSVKSGTPHLVNVTITVAANTQPISNINVPVSQFNIVGDTTNMWLDTNVNVSVRGRNINSNEISGTINVEGLDQGEHNIQVDVLLPSGFTLTGNSFIRVVVNGDLYQTGINEDTSEPSEEYTDEPIYEEDVIETDVIENTINDTEDYNEILEEDIEGLYVPAYTEDTEEEL